MTQTFFVTSSGTEIGKTYVTALMCRALMRRGHRVGALKPIMSGYDAAAMEQSDAGQLLQALDAPITEETIAAISPWRFEPPISPDMAAKRAGSVIRLETLVAFCRLGEESQPDVLFIEAAGGVMAPINDETVMRDWAAALNVPALLVVGSYLGTISHTLTAIEALKAKQIPIHAIIISESEDNPVPLAETAAAIGRYTEAPILCVTRDATEMSDAQVDALLS